MSHSDYTGFYYQDIEEQKEKQKNTEDVIEYENYSREELEKVTNDDLKQRLDQLEIEYDAKAIKKDLISLLIGEEKVEEKTTETE